jgi:uncharacterized membrane protein YhaH (DUF805 family)
MRRKGFGSPTAVWSIVWANPRHFGSRRFFLRVGWRCADTSSMSFADAVKTCFAKYVDFKGRASRAEYWWFALFVGLVYVVGVVLISIDENVGALLFVVALLGVILPQLAAAVRRLHDTGKSGAWYLIALVPYIGGIWLIVLLAQKSQPGANIYGPPTSGAVAPPAPPAAPLSAPQGFPARPDEGGMLPQSGWQ